MIGMKDQYFGVEVEMTGITRRQAARALADYFGTEPYQDSDYYGSWYVTDSDGKKWRFMSDSSIRKERKIGTGYERTSDGEYSVEMVSPKLTYHPRPADDVRRGDAGASGGQQGGTGQRHGNPPVHCPQTPLPAYNTELAAGGRPCNRAALGPAGQFQILCNRQKRCK